VFEVVNPMFEELLNAVKENTQTTIDCATILHDTAGMTGGMFLLKKVDEEGNNVVNELGEFVREWSSLFNTQDKIFSHVSDPPTAYNPENMQVYGEEPAQEGEPQEEVVEEVVEEEVQEGE